MGKIHDSVAHAPKHAVEGACVAVLEQLKRTVGLPQQIAVDNGPEYISKALDACAYRNGVKLEFSRPGKPTDNAYVESFNGHFREECLKSALVRDLG
jgi:putative transposase